MIRHRWWLWLAIFTSAASAQPSEFVRGRVIDAPEGESVVRVVVPQDVYEWVTRRDLGDLRVLNGAQEEVPYRIRRPQSRKEFSEWMDVPVFTLPTAEVDPEKSARVDIQLDELGAVVAVNGVAAGAREPGAVLLDASQLDRPVAELRADWRPVEGGFVGKFRVDASNDLNAWSTVVESATLAELNAEVGEVRVDVIELRPRKARYFRVTQMEGNRPLLFASVSVRSRETQLPERHSKSLAGEAVKDGYEFHTGGLFPLDRLAVTLDAESYLVVVDLFSRSKPKDPWRSRGQHTFYKAAVNGAIVRSAPVASGRQDQYWRVELASGTSGVPALEVSWRPDEVLLLNQPPGPLLLVYGRAGLEGRPWPLKQLLAQSDADADLVFSLLRWCQRPVRQAWRG